MDYSYDHYHHLSNDFQIHTDVSYAFLPTSKEKNSIPSNIVSELIYEEYFLNINNVIPK